MQPVGSWECPSCAGGRFRQPLAAPVAALEVAAAEGRKRKRKVRPAPAIAGSAADLCVSPLRVPRLALLLGATNQSPATGGKKRRRAVLAEEGTVG